MAESTIEKPMPMSYINKTEYENMKNALKQSQEEAFAKRVAKNKEYENIVTEKLISKYKKFMKQEEAKKRDPDTYYVPAEPKFLVAVLIRSKRRVNPTIRTTLKLLRLKTINSCVILRNNKSIQNMLRIVKDFVAYGYLEYEKLRELLAKRGFGKLGDSKVKLTNENIEDGLSGKYRCLEELVYNIYFGCDDIKEILNFLWPMRLSCPKGGFPGRKSMNFLQGGCTNFSGELLHTILEKMI